MSLLFWRKTLTGSGHPEPVAANETNPLPVQSAQLPTALAASGGIKVEGVAGGVAQPVSGTFWQATQPVSGTVTANQGGAPWSQTISGVTAAKLQKSKQPRTTITCAVASTDYAAAAAMPAGTKYLWTYCASEAIIAMGEATSATVGAVIPPSSPVLFPVTVTGTAADDTPHAQSATAGAVVHLCYLQD